MLVCRSSVEVAVRDSTDSQSQTKCVARSTPRPPRFRSISTFSAAFLEQGGVLQPTVRPQPAGWPEPSRSVHHPACLLTTFRGYLGGDAADHRTQCLSRVRLRDDGLNTSRPRLRLVDAGTPAGGQCDADARPALSHLLGHVPAIHAAAQPEVGDHHIELLLLQQIQRGVSRGREFDPVALLLEYEC